MARAPLPAVQGELFCNWHGSCKKTGRVRGFEFLRSAFCDRAPCPQTRTLRTMRADSPDQADLCHLLTAEQYATRKFAQAEALRSVSVVARIVAPSAWIRGRIKSIESTVLKMRAKHLDLEQILDPSRFESSCPHGLSVTNLSSRFMLDSSLWRENSTTTSKPPSQMDTSLCTRHSSDHEASRWKCRFGRRQCTHWPNTDLLRTGSTRSKLPSLAVRPDSCLFRNRRPVTDPTTRFGGQCEMQSPRTRHRWWQPEGSRG